MKRTERSQELLGQKYPVTGIFDAVTDTYHSTHGHSGENDVYIRPAMGSPLFS